MTVGKLDGQAVLEAVQNAIVAHGAAKEELIPILSDVNRSLGYIPREAMDEISRQLRVPKSQLFSVASFYQMLSTRPLGKHVIHFCESAPCHVAGGRQVLQALQQAVNLKPGETSQDGQWSLLTTSCLGVCGVGPVMTVDEDIYGNITPGQIKEILARYQ
ncbi:MAG TPA: NADH-quinone oxidoreductase subunit NuoE [Anaerolineaceae bacterium]